MPNKRLYTESDVAALARGSTLVLGKDALATPSALDLAFARGVRVSWAEGESGTAAAAATRDETLSRMLAEDGTYVVAVRAGRAVITRLENGVPVPFGTTAAH